MTPRFFPWHRVHQINNLHSCKSCYVQNKGPRIIRSSFLWAQHLWYCAFCAAQVSSLFSRNYPLSKLHKCDISSTADASCSPVTSGTDSRRISCQKPRKRKKKTKQKWTWVVPQHQACLGTSWIDDNIIKYFIVRKRWNYIVYWVDIAINA